MLDTVESRAAERAPFALDRCHDVSVCDLNGAERFVVWAIRWRCSDQDDEEFADACLQDSFDRAGLPAARHALEQFVCAACPDAKLKVALESLQDMAVALQRSGGVIHRWKPPGLVDSSGVVH